MPAAANTKIAAVATKRGEVGERVEVSKRGEVRLRHEERVFLRLQEHGEEEELRLEAAQKAMAQKIFPKVLERASGLVDTDGRVALCQIVRTEGSTPGKPGYKPKN